ncbi:MAG: hypothetical protein ACRDV1_00430 [Actinomycetes bacterium]
MDDPDALRQAAVALRRQGLSTSQIASELGIRRSSTLSGWLVGTPPPDWTKRPRAKDAERERARAMRREGRSYAEIAGELGVSKSSVSLWVRDLPVPPGLAERALHAQRIGGDRWLRERRHREIDRQQTKFAAAKEIGDLSPRELLLVGAALYWAEGEKDKPYARRERVMFTNSDARVIQVFARWLDLVGVPPELRGYRISIHESADVEAAHRFWSGVVDVPISEFHRATLKRHKPKTVRLNVGPDYHGCLVITVRQGRDLYQRVEGMFYGIVLGAGRCTVGGSRTSSLESHDPPWGNW